MLHYALAASSEPRVSRRIFAFAAAMLLLCASFTSSALAQSTAPDKVRLGSLIGSSIAALTAAEKGYFKEQNLDVELVPMKSGPDGQAATTSGAVQVSYGDFLSWVSALGNDFANIRMILPANTSGLYTLLVKNDSGIKLGKDLANKRVGVPAAVVFTIATRLWLQQNGVDPDSVQYVIVPYGSEGNALAQGSVDAILTPDPTTHVLQHRHKAVILSDDPLREVFPAGATMAAYYANAQFIQNNPQVVERLVKALHKGGAYFLKATPEEKAKIHSKYSRVNFDDLKDIPNILAEYRYPDVQLEPLNVQSGKEWVKKAFSTGKLPKEVDFLPFVHATALKPVQ